MYLARYFRKNSLWAKTTKCGQIWRKNMVFPLFWKNLSLIFAENILKLKLILLSILLHKFQYLGKLFFSSYSWKGFQNAVFFDHIYILMKWPDDIDFLHVDRYLEEEKKFNQIFQWCSAYRLLQSCSVIENIEWKEETFPCIFK